MSSFLFFFNKAANCLSANARERGHAQYGKCLQGFPVTINGGD